ncbi:MAG: hypothetical protein HWD61_07770 [Parachlamydiaceae bacterium]|nr:MAG: hypothetical protein HWD61_07770 [Parachlamydiaceae bacterium]
MGQFALLRVEIVIFFDGKEEFFITSVQHAILCRTIEQNTLPKEEAVRAQSGGQESKNIFMKSRKAKLLDST